MLGKLDSSSFLKLQFHLQLKIAEEPGPIVMGLPICEECQKEFKDSWLLQKFDYSVCDLCRYFQKHSIMKIDGIQWRKDAMDLCPS